MATSRAARRRRWVALTAVTLFAALTVVGCGSGGPTAPGDARPTTLVLADAQDLGQYNPVRGYGELGVSLLYDGLLRLDSAGDRNLPALTPALAAALPQPDASLTRWRIPLRTGVTFHDGTTFDAADVVATYRAIIDPASASDLASSLDMLASVAADGNVVTFTLAYPYADFATRLLIAIAPSEKLGAGPATESSLNTSPVGTGPYRLTELTPDRAVFDANGAYFAGAPAVSRLVTVHMPDDNSRAQRMTAGDIDGTSLPPLLARSFEGRDGVRVDAAQSADWRAVALPRVSAFARDPAARLAMNLAVDREAMVRTVLAGRGRVAHTPVASIYGEAFSPTATFPYDRTRATQLLDAAGWVPDASGIRRKGDEVARFTLAYRPTDVLRRDLATAFAADMKKIGVDVRLEGLDFAAIEPRIGELGILLGGGDKPYSLDTQVFGALHTKVPGSSPWDNPANLGSARLDEALQRARRTVDPAARVAAYRDVQQTYVADPSYVFLAFLDHTYVSKRDGWNRGSLVVEPHAHGVGWGPWWNVHTWR